jgi:ABC-2 type transport system ATP-binding protein
MIEARGVYKKYKKSVLSGIDFTAAPGEAVGVAGENGSGKSTLLSVLTSVIRPEAGTVTAEGENIFTNKQALKKYIGYVPQENALFDSLSALDNLKYWAAAYGADWKNALPYLFPGVITVTDEKRKRNSLLRHNDDIRDFLRKKAGKLSGGMKKRLSIALSMMHDPLYLIMDEPSAGLDIGFKWSLTETIRDLCGKGRCVIITTHQPDELLLCDRIYILKNGGFIFEGPPSELNADGNIGETLRVMIRK